MKISVSDCEEVCVNYATEIAEAEKLNKDTSVISVYIPSAGDSLWNTAKKLCQSPEEISATNPDLVFPLTGNERILVYRTKNS